MARTRLLDRVHGEEADGIFDALAKREIKVRRHRFSDGVIFNRRASRLYIECRFFGTSRGESITREGIWGALFSVSHSRNQPAP
jgi:hypothetical protein